MLKDTKVKYGGKRNMKKIKLKKNMANFLLTVLAFMATAGVNNYSISDYIKQKPDDFVFKIHTISKIIKSMYRCIFRIVYESV